VITDITEITAHGTFTKNSVSENPVTQANAASRSFVNTDKFYYTPFVPFDFRNMDIFIQATDSVLTSPVTTFSVNIQPVQTFPVFETNPPLCTTYEIQENSGNHDIVIMVTHPRETSALGFLFVSMPTKGVVYMDQTAASVDIQGYNPVTSVPTMFTTGNDFYYAIGSSYWPIRYVPNLHTNTYPHTTLDSFTIHGCQTIDTTVNVCPDPVSTCVMSFRILAVNSPPTLTIANNKVAFAWQGSGYPGTGVWSPHHLVVGPLSLSDDALSTDSVSITVTLTNFNSRWSSMTVAGATLTSSNPITYTLTATKSTIESVLSGGIQLIPAQFSAGVGDCNPCGSVDVLFSDLGNFREVGSATPLTTSLNIPVAIDDLAQNSFSAPGNFGVSSALVGVTVILTLGFAGVYRILKKNKWIISEEDETHLITLMSPGEKGTAPNVLPWNVTVTSTSGSNIESGQMVDIGLEKK
jgi:hypothetical protein